LLWNSEDMFSPQLSQKLAGFSSSFREIGPVGL
jgi:hypothetical protein